MTNVKIAIIDYGLGNLRSVKRGFERSGGDVIVTSDIDIISHADGVVLQEWERFQRVWKMQNHSKKALLKLEKVGFLCLVFV